MRTFAPSGVLFLSITALAAPLPQGGDDSNVSPPGMAIERRDLQELGVTNEMFIPFCDEVDDGYHSIEDPVDHVDVAAIADKDEHEELETLSGDPKQLEEQQGGSATTDTGGGGHKSGNGTSSILLEKIKQQQQQRYPRRAGLPEGGEWHLRKSVLARSLFRRESVYRGGRLGAETDPGYHYNPVYEPAYQDLLDDDDVWKRGLGYFHFMGIAIASGCRKAQPVRAPKPLQRRSY